MAMYVHIRTLKDNNITNNKDTNVTKNNTLTEDLFFWVCSIC